MSPQATPIQSKMQFRMDWGLEPRGFVSTRLTIKLDEMKLKTIYGNVLWLPTSIYIMHSFFRTAYIHFVYYKTASCVYGAPVYL
jgi:hypothetical protein